MDQLNLRKLKCREAIGSIPISAADYDYDLAIVLTDFVELMDPMTGLRLASTGASIPLARTRGQFVEGWRPTLESGPPIVARIIAKVLQLRPTPATADTITIEYYKLLATPTLSGSVTIPDDLLTLVRARMSTRLEGYLESDTAERRIAIAAAMEQDCLRVIRQEEVSQMPGEVLQEDPL